MAVRIRLKRMGRRNLPFYRIEAFDSRTKRDGRSIENLGFYDPLLKEEDAKVKLKKDRIEYWLSVGAQPTETVKKFLRKAGIRKPQATATK